jgi:Lon protease-like protein
MATSIPINFGKPFALFPLREVALLPHAVQPLHVFEPRYRQMVEQVLDGSGQIAMASYATDPDDDAVGERPALRRAVCVGQVVQHETLPDGRHNILVHGLCRATVKRIEEANDERLYRQAYVEPTEALDADPPDLPKVRRRLRKILGRRRMKQLRSIDTVIEWIDQNEIPTIALIELIGFALVTRDDVKYRLLEESEAERRAELVADELCRIDQIVGAAERQSFRDWPKGVSWN